jgi:hypothetical protein
MKNKQLRNAIDMIAQGYDLHLVLDITGVDPDLLLDVLTDMLGDEPQQSVKVVETLQHFNSESIGMFKVNIN